MTMEEVVEWVCKEYNIRLRENITKIINEFMELPDIKFTNLCVCDIEAAASNFEN
jgi:hypothetical protein